MAAKEFGVNNIAGADVIDPRRAHVAAQKYDTALWFGAA